MFYFIRVTVYKRMYTFTSLVIVESADETSLSVVRALGEDFAQI